MIYFLKKDRPIKKPLVPPQWLPSWERWNKSFWSVSVVSGSMVEQIPGCSLASGLALICITWMSSQASALTLSVVMPISASTVTVLGVPSPICEVYAVRWLFFLTTLIQRRDWHKETRKATTIHFVESELSVDPFLGFLYLIPYRRHQSLASGYEPGLTTGYLFAWFSGLNWKPGLTSLPSILK